MYAATLLRITPPRFALLAVVVAGALVSASAGRGAPTEAPTTLLPDLEQVEPHGLVVSRVGHGLRAIFRLGFESAFDNVGSGPLVIDAHRPGTGTPDLTADQLVEHSDGSEQVMRSVGRLHFERFGGHDHWHYRGFERYELRTARSYRLVGRDHKVGFCLADVYKAFPLAPLPAQPPATVFTGRCGRGQPRLLELREGMSVGYGDVYEPNVAGQFVDVTHVPPGKYVLVHRVNPDRTIAESDYDNDASSVLIAIMWPHGRDATPFVHFLRGCPGRAVCR